MKLLLNVIGYVLLAGGGIGLAFASINMQMEVNDKLPMERRYSYWIQWPGKTLVLLGLHRQFYPESDLGKFLGKCFLSVIAGLVLLALTGQL